MLYRDINHAFTEYHREFNEEPKELFINHATRDELLKTKGLENQISPFEKPFSRIFGCPSYVVDMNESFMWLSESDLKGLSKSRNTPLEESWDYIPVTRINRSKERAQINIPRVIRDFKYP